jgi:hypothetical protein
MILVPFRWSVLLATVTVIGSPGKDWMRLMDHEPLDVVVVIPPCPVRGSVRVTRRFDRQEPLGEVTVPLALVFTVFPGGARVKVVELE